MKVRIIQTVNASNYYRLAINHYYGMPGLATRDEVRAWVIRYGTSMDDDISAALDAALSRYD